MFTTPSGATQELDRLAEWEWLETNGTGAFAMGTAASLSTRRYHGLLVASLRPPVQRFLILARLEEQVVTPSGGFELATNQYPGVIHPQGHRHLESFALDPFPRWTYRLGEVRLHKWLWLVPGEQTVVVRYRMEGPGRLRLRPLLAFRDYHALTHANSAVDPHWSEASSLEGRRTWSWRPYGSLPALHLDFVGGASPRGQGWYFANQYRVEQARGLDFEEDLWCAGTLELQVGAQVASLVASLEERFRPRSEAELEELEAARNRPPAPGPIPRLERAADAYRAQRADGHPTLLAGYPWFTDWGRDAMISLPGLLLSRGLGSEAGNVLRGFLAHLSQGLIPNRFPDAGETPEYNTADATLWLFHAAHCLMESGADPSFLRDELYPSLRDSVEWHVRGTHHGIQVDSSDGLLIAGGPGSQLTWMDAKVGDQVITPRHGKAVELNALWLNALRVMEGFAGRLEKASDQAEYRVRAERTETAFRRVFWNPERQCLYDVVRPEGCDAALRPNQLLAVSLPFSALSADQMRAVVTTCEQALLTPYGLRTLAPGEPQYRGRYQGGPAERDAAYHQGTVWPWLLGPFVDAYLRAFGPTEENRVHCRRLFQPLFAHLDDACVNQVSELFDGDPPHRPGGAPAQAWSVAELLRVARLLYTAPLP